MNDSSFYTKKFHEVKSHLSSGTKLLIVSKTRSKEEIKAYYDLGQRDFGENRVQDLLEKSQQLKNLCPEIRWHMIGHLQSNKINQLLSVPNLVSIHSVDNTELLKKILLKESLLTHSLGLFLQVNTSQEEEKSGFETLSELENAFSCFNQKSHFYPQGLMTMGRVRTDDLKRDARLCFRALNELKNCLENKLNFSLETSMGMSQDFEIAIQEGSSWIRLGSVMFQ